MANGLNGYKFITAIGTLFAVAGVISGYALRMQSEDSANKLAISLLEKRVLAVEVRFESADTRLGEKGWTRANTILLFERLGILANHPVPDPSEIE